MADLTTLEAVKAYAGVVGEADDDMLSALVTGYSDLIRSYTGRDFTQTAYSRRFDGRNNDRLILPQTPIVSVAGLSIDGQVIPVQLAFGQPGFRFDDTSLILDGYRFSRGAGNIQVNWVAGYATVPAGVAQATNEIVALRYALRDHQGWASKSLAGETVSFITKSMPDSAKLALDQYRVVI